MSDDLIDRARRALAIVPARRVGGTGTEAAPTTVRVHGDVTGELLMRVMQYVADLRLVNQGPLAAPSMRWEVYTFAGGDIVRTFGASPTEAIVNFAALIEARIGRQL